MKEVKIGNEKKNISFNQFEDGDNVEITINNINDTLRIVASVDDLKIVLRYLTEET